MFLWKYFVWCQNIFYKASLRSHDCAQHDNAILCRPLSFRLRCHPLTFLLFRAHIPSFRTNVRNPPLSVIPSLPRNLFGCCALGRGLALYRGDVSTTLNMTLPCHSEPTEESLCLTCHSERMWEILLGLRFVLVAALSGDSSTALRVT